MIIETCPKCGAVLMDTIICTNPPIPCKDCPSCEWHWEGNPDVVKLYNHTFDDYYVSVGDKISQLVIVPILTPELEFVDDLEGGERGDNGFGSTGR